MLNRKDDLFEESSSMSFGDHLEELRVCLWWSIIWLVAGTVVGFYFSGSVVKFIQEPLHTSLQKYRSEKQIKEVSEVSQALAKEGYHVDQLMLLPDKTEHLVPEIYYIFPGQLESLIDSKVVQIPQKKENGSGGGILNEIDNLNQYERKTPADKHAGDDVVQTKRHARIQLDAEPRPFILFQKKEKLPGTTSQALGVHEGFMIYIKAALMVGFVVGSPGIFYSLWSFVAAGLYYKERKYVYIFLPFSVLLFVAGACLAFFFVFGFVLDFLFAFNASMNIDPDTRISEWINFAFLLPVGFGISFQLPLVMFVLERVGIFTVENYISKWKISVMIIFVISMFLTPADPYSLVLMAVPLTGLYFLGIGVCQLIPKPKNEFDDTESLN